MGGMVVAAVRNILRRRGLQPHRVKTFKVSRVPRFEPKITDIVGLDVDPSDHAVVLSVDEKTQVQASGRTQEPLPMTEGHAETRTHDTRRNGTSCLMAALDVATGTVVGRMVPRHRSQEFPAFLDPVASGIDPATEVKVILDNVSSHKSAEVHEWLRDHPRWSFHFTPTSATWTNAVEGFFARLTRRRLKHAIFNSLDGCVAAIEAFIAHHDAKEARPFKWSRKPEDFMESWKRGYLHHVVRAREIIGSMLLTWHNLHFYQELMKGIRSAIAEGRMTGFASSMRDSLAAGDVDPIDLD